MIPKKIPSNKTRRGNRGKHICPKCGKACPVTEQWKEFLKGTIKVKVAKCPRCNWTTEIY